jgi:hypothetical protein
VVPCRLDEAESIGMAGNPDQSPLSASLPAQEAQPSDPDADTPFDYPERRTVQAADTKPVKTRAARSIWDAAVNGFGGAGFAMVLAEMSAPCRIERDGDITRVVRLAHDETPEYIERERVRRELQRFKCPPPRPTKRAKTRGKKVRAWDGEDME